MNQTLLGMLTALVAASAVGLIPALSQDEGGEPSGRKNAAPLVKSDQLKALATLAGEFDRSTKTWNAPGKEPAEARGSSERSVILNGMYLRETYAMKSGRFAHEGEMTWGYDPATRKLQFVHIYSFQTGMQVLETQWDGTSKSFEFKFSGKHQDLEYDARYVFTLESDDKQKLEIMTSYKDAAGTPQPEIKEIEVVYTRKEQPEEG
jgi:hypothetical protein